MTAISCEICLLGITSRQILSRKAMYTHRLLHCMQPYNLKVEILYLLKTEVIPISISSAYGYVKRK